MEVKHEELGNKRNVIVFKSVWFPILFIMTVSQHSVLKKKETNSMVEYQLLGN